MRTINLRKINKNIIEFIMLIFLFEPIIFVKINLLNNLFIGGIIVTFIYCIYNYTHNYMIKFNKLDLAIIVYRMILLIPIILYDGDIIKWGYQSINHLSISMMMNLAFKENKRKALKMIQLIFTIYLFVNIILLFKYPKGILPAYYELNFLGIRTRFTDYAFPLVFISLLINKNKFWNIISITVALFNIFYSSISTAIVGLFISLITFLILTFVNKKNTVIKPKGIIIIGSIITIAVTFFGAQNIFSNIIEETLNKNVTLTGRTEIWQESFKYINDKIVLGHGYSNDGNFVYWRGMLWQAHSQILQLLYDGGIVSLIFFVKILFVTVSTHSKAIKTKDSKILMSGFLGFIIMMISEIYGYYPGFYLYMAVTYLVGIYATENLKIKDGKNE